MELVNAVDKAKRRLDSVVDKGNNGNASVFDKVLNETEKLTREDRKAVHDILSALRLGKNTGLAFGHSIEYWTLDERRVPSEIFANIGTLDVMEKKGLNVIRTYFPEIFKTYIGVVK